MIDNRFGKLLRFYRERSYDRERERPLTQDRLGELVGWELDREAFTGATVSEWELNETN